MFCLLNNRISIQFKPYSTRIYNKKVVKCWQPKILWKSFFINSHFICYYWLQKNHLKLIIWGLHKAIFGIWNVWRNVIQYHKRQKSSLFSHLFHDCWWYSATTPILYPSYVCMNWNECNPFKIAHLLSIRQMIISHEGFVRMW